MLSKLIGIVLGCGLAAALTASAMACDFHTTSATNDQAAPQQTAQTESSAAQSEPSAEVSTQ